jgi:hypothetical protein
MFVIFVLCCLSSSTEECVEKRFAYGKAKDPPGTYSRNIPGSRYVELIIAVITSPA